MHVIQIHNISVRGDSYGYVDFRKILQNFDFLMWEWEANAFQPIFCFLFHPQVLKLMIEAWRRRLMFTVGTSYTTGISDTVTWNEIHHKTELYGNHSGHGYPDPAYLANVVLELANHGVTVDCLWANN